MDETLKRLLYERLQSDGSIDSDWSVYVIAACEDGGELDRALELSPSAVASLPEKPPEREPLGAYLRSITVQGFRGIGPEATLELTPGPGLTLVVGRNGSGKSSFAEALEVLFTGDSKHFDKPWKVWREGWRNLHHGHPALVEATILVEGQGETRVAREWEEGEELDSGRTWAQVHGKPRTDLDALGWSYPLVAYRPFLSYDELGSMLDEGPSKLFDALSLALGLEDLVAAEKLLRDARLGRERALKEARAQLRSLVAELEQLAEAAGDERAVRCLEALGAKSWNLDTVESLATAGPALPGGEIELLRRAASLTPPDVSEALDAAHGLRTVVRELERTSDSDAARARATAELLERALAFHSQHRKSNCPVCGKRDALDASWHERSRSEVEQLREIAKECDEVHRMADRARRRAQDLMPVAPALLGQLGDVGIDTTTLKRYWEAWRGGLETADCAALADHVEAALPSLRDEIVAVAAAADRELQTREDLWKPVAVRLARWVASGRSAQEGASRVPGLKSAESWLKRATAEIRNQRFTPISERAMATWSHLRQQSNVELGRIELTGASTRRQVALEVTVDGVQGAALSVMSQGELHSLALSLFLPRARLPESPFRFVVIDDPVQSMDPARVDGLARALEETAEDRQVVVFTHDDRLSESVRALGIAATNIAVTRRPGSIVELREGLHPVLAYFGDAHAVIRTDELSDGIRRRVVPGLCRLALEAACTEVVRKRRLARGVPHADVEGLIVAADKLSKLMALALFDDTERAGEVRERLNGIGRWATDVYAQANKGAHVAHEGDLETFARQAERLSKELLRLQ